MLPWKKPAEKKPSDLPVINYILRRLLLIIPTLFGVLLINFTIVQLAPGGPVERVMTQYYGLSPGASMGAGNSGNDLSGNYRGADGVNPQFIKELEKQFGFDKPVHVRFIKMLGDYFRLDFGKSYFRNAPVTELIIERLPVSLSLAFWTLCLTYGISIPLGIRKAVHNGSRFDIWSSGVIIVGYAIPGFFFALILIVLFAGGSYLQIFPLRGLVSDNWPELDWSARIFDYFRHITLPVISMAIGGFAGLTILTKNSFLDEIHKLYVTTARSKGLTQKQVLYGHIFRNAMLIVIAGFPAAFTSVLLTSTLLIEIIFSLNGLGLLGFEAILNRDYPVIFGSLFIFTILGLVLNLAGDITYTIVDPRIDFDTRDT